MKLGFISSGALHLLVILIVWLGLPHIKRDPPKLDKLIFVKLADVAKVTNLPPEMDSQPKKKSKIKSPNTKQSAKQKRASSLENKKPQLVRDKTVPLPETKPRKRPKSAKLKATKPKAKPKPRPIFKASKRPKPTKRPIKKQFTSLLRNLKKEKIDQRKRIEKKSIGDRLRKISKNRSSGDFWEDQKVTMSEIDVLRQQIAGCWNIAAGARQAEALSVEIEMRMNPDATVQTAQVVDGTRMNSDPFFRAAAESALRALSHPDCIPLKLPVGKYEVWKSFTFNFDPKNMLQ
tara:strand:- start:1705 stop:2574 length:870 start_codon:yes stop_codon:yes gene_type:complete